MELDERICRAILKNAWDTAAADKDEGEMPEFPSNVRPARKSYTVERTRRDDGVFEKRIPCVAPAHTVWGFYRDYLLRVLNAVEMES